MKTLQFPDGIPETTERERALYQRHFELLQSWNERMSLVSGKSLETAMGTHYADSLFTVDFAKKHGVAPFFDLGSGAGFPGLVFGIRFPDEPLTLFEKSQKKQSFLMTAIQQLELSNVTLAGVLENGRYDGTFLARAVHPPLELIAFLQKLSFPGMRVVISLGGSNEPPVLPTSVKLVAESRYDLPEDRGSRRLMMVEFVSRGTK